MFAGGETTVEAQGLKVERQHAFPMHGNTYPTLMPMAQYKLSSTCHEYSFEDQNNPWSFRTAS